MHTTLPYQSSNIKVRDFNKLATIKIHNEGLTSHFTVPAILITSRSEFCKTALKQCWQQDGTQTINLYSRDPEVFALYLHILYGKSLDVRHSNKRVAEQQTSTDYVTLCQIYVLAEFLQDQVTTELLMKYFWDALIEGDYTKRALRSVPCADALHILYCGTVKGCPARRLIVDTFAHADLRKVISDEERWPEAFTFELALALYEQVNFKGGQWSNTDNLLSRLNKSDYFKIF